MAAFSEVTQGVDHLMLAGGDSDVGGSAETSFDPMAPGFLLTASGVVADSAPPLLDTAWAPDGGTITRTTAIDLPVVDAASSIAACDVFVYYGDGSSELIYTRAFGWEEKFDSGDQSGDPDATPGSIDLFISRNDGWPNASMTLVANVVDGAGNVATFTKAFTVTNPPAAPALNGAFSPSDGATIARGGSITVPIASDPSTTLAALTVLAAFGSARPAEIVWQGAFVTGYAGTVSGALGTDEISITFHRVEGWPAEELHVQARAIDAAGRYVDLEATYAVSDPATPDVDAPTVGNFSPAPGTPIGRRDPVSFDVTDASNIAAVLVLAAFADGTYEVVHDGDAFAPAYAATSMRTTITGGYRFSVARAAGWTSGGPTIRIVAIDPSGNRS